MEHLKKMKETLDKELREYADKRDLSAGDLTVIHTLTDTIKNLDKICLLEEEGGYSGGHMREPTKMMPGYEDGYSYGRHWVRGHYSRGGSDRRTKLADELDRMMDRFTDREWDMLDDFVRRFREG